MSKYEFNISKSSKVRIINCIEEFLIYIDINIKLYNRIVTYTKVSSARNSIQIEFTQYVFGVLIKLFFLIPKKTIMIKKKTLIICFATATIA